MIEQARRARLREVTDRILQLVPAIGARLAPRTASYRCARLELGAKLREVSEHAGQPRERSAAIDEHDVAIA